MEMLQGVWKQHLRPRAVVGYGVKIIVPSPPNYVTRSPGRVVLCANCKNYRTRKSVVVALAQISSCKTCDLSMFG